MLHKNFSREMSVISEGKTIAGIDEVGRGCIAGPVYAAIVSVNNKNQYIPEVRDSKKLSAIKRDNIAVKIKKICHQYAIGFSSVKEIERLGIGKAVAMAMERAYKKLEHKPDVVIIDGCRITKPNIDCELIRKGDEKHFCISAASIIAKVARDSYMKKISRKYTHYGFENNVGYGTKLHRQAIKKYGITPLHRKNFLPIKGSTLINK